MTFYRLSSHRVFKGNKFFVKVSETDLNYETDIVNYLSELGFPALPPISQHKTEGYYVYVFPKGETDISENESVPWLSANLVKLHNMNMPKVPKIMTYEAEVMDKLKRWEVGYSLLSVPVIKKIEDSLSKAFNLPTECLCHRDPLMGNIVKLGTKLYLIDWEHVARGPIELDLAVIKCNEFFGAPAKIFNDVSLAYGKFDEKKLQIMVNARVAYSIVWYAKNVYKGYFKNNGELEKVVARLR